MLEALVFGTFWFWAISAAFFFLILAFSENDRNFFAFVSFAGFVALMSGAGNFKFGEILSHPVKLLMWLAIYFAVGTIWSIIKWFSKLHQKHDQYLEFKEKFITNHPELALRPNEPIPDSRWEMFARQLAASGYCANPNTYAGEAPARENVKPHWRAWRGRLTGWILWWPTSAFWTILSDPMVRLANWIRDRFRRVYSAIADRTFSDV